MTYDVPQLIVFDFDGVVADSEMLANAALAEAINQLGVSISLEETIRLFVGKRSQETYVTIEQLAKKALPSDFVSAFRERRSKRFERELTLIEGLEDYIHSFREIPQCIASQSSREYIISCLGILGLERFSEANIFSASGMERGKPHPDIYLHAMREMGAQPEKTIIIEDSITGVEAGVASGATVIGLLAGSHIQNGHAQKLREAGVNYIAETYLNAADITRSLLVS